MMTDGDEHNEDADEFQNFDPKRYWAAANNEKHSDVSPRLSEWLEMAIKYCYEPRAVEDIRREAANKHWNFTRVFDLVAHTYGLRLEKTIKAKKTYYQIKDFRTAGKLVKRK